MADPIQPDTLEDGDGDIGLDADVVTLEQSQSVNDYEPEYEGELYPEPLGLPPGADPDEATALDESDGPILLNADAGDLTTLRGTGANDDAGGLGDYFGFFNTSGTPSNSAAPAGTGRITPQPNVLDRFATYTYSASVYIMTPEQLDAYTRSGRRNVQGYNLLFQSGGAPNNIGGPQGGTGSSNAGRNPFFPLDYYIDSITINNSLFGKSTNAAHSAVDMKFTVIEPTGITLIDNIYKAAQDLAPQTAAGSINYAAAVYLMVIRFYGQDINGNIQQVGASDSTTGLSDANALVEKFIPFKIKEIKFSISNRLVTYEFDTAPIGQMIGAGTRRGTIPADIELSATTVGAMLTGDAQYGGATASATSQGSRLSADQVATLEELESNAPAPGNTAADQLNGVGEDGRSSTSSPTVSSNAPAKANAAPNNKKTIKQGLIAAMNEFQKELVKKKIYDVADEYVLEFANGAEAIRDGKIAKPDKKVNKSATPMSAAPSQNTQSASPDKSNVDVTARNWGVTAGMQMVQVIDLIIRNSSYITDQALVSIDELTGKPVPNPKTGSKGMKWYNIIMKTTQLGHDRRRNDYAYRITYTIVPYTLTDFNSPYFPIGNFRGVHKRYPYWFTGQNTQVLDYQASFNKLYNLTISGPDGTSNLSKVREKYTSSMRDIAFYQYQARSTESAQGAQGKANELAASAAEYLYNPSDNGNGKIRIVGDPAWLQQGSVTNTIQSKAVVFSPFLPDGTINFDVNDVMFEIAWQKPQDYNLNSGLADPYSNSGNDRTPTQSVVYRAKSVQSEFRQGRFEQTIEGTLYSYPVPSGTNKATTASNPVAPSGDADAQEGGFYGTSDNSDAERVPLGEQTINTGNRTSGDQNNSDEELVQLGGPGFNDFSQSAEYENYGGPGLVVEPDFDYIDPGSESGEFEYRSPTPDDDAAPALLNIDADSNGEVVGNAFGDAVPTSGRITGAQRAQINQNIRTENIDGFDVEINPEPGNPQIIARDW